MKVSSYIMGRDLRNSPFVLRYRSTNGELPPPFTLRYPSTRLRTGLRANGGGNGAFRFILALCAALWAGTLAAEPKNSQDAALQQVLRKAQGVVRQLTQDKAALEAEKTALAAEKAALEEKVRKLEEALKPLEALPAEVARCKADTESLRSAKTNLESQLGQGREQAQALLKKHQEVIAKARDIRADNRLLVEAVKEREQWIEQCGKRNQDLVGTGRELAEKYKDKSFWDELADLEPLTGIGKVKSENAAEEYRYRLQRLRATPFEAQVPGEKSSEEAFAPAEADGEGEQ